MRSQRAFSLIEMLVVITIFSVLVGILMPAIDAARRKSRASVCINNLHQVGLAMQHYRDDHDDFMPRILADGRPRPSFDGWSLLPTAYADLDSSPSNPDSFLYYCKDAGVLNCPDDNDATLYSYGMNGRITSVVNRFRELVYPSELPIVFDASSSIAYYYSDIDPRHFGGANALYADGRVSRLNFRWTSFASGAEPLPGLGDPVGPLDEGMSFMFRIAGTPGDQVEFAMTEDGVEFARTVIIQRTTGRPNTESLGPYFLDPDNKTYVVNICYLPEAHGGTPVWIGVNDGGWVKLVTLNHRKTSATVDITSILAGN